MITLRGKLEENGGYGGSVKNLTLPHYVRVGVGAKGQSDERCGSGGGASWIVVGDELVAVGGGGGGGGDGPETINHDAVKEPGTGYGGRYVNNGQGYGAAGGGWLSDGANNNYAGEDNSNSGGKSLRDYGGKGGTIKYGTEGGFGGGGAGGVRTGWWSVDIVGEMVVMVYSEVVSFMWGEEAVRALAKLDTVEEKVSQDLIPR